MSVRVLWLVKGLGRGGAERLIRGIAPRIDKTRVEVDVAYLLASKDAFVPELREAGFTLHCLDAQRTLDPAWVWRLRRLLHRERYDVVHTHSPVPAVMARLIAPRSTRFIHTEHNVWDSYRGLTRSANALTYGRNAVVWAVSDGVADTIRLPRWLPGPRPRIITMLHGVEVDGMPRGPAARQAAREALDLDPDVPVIGTVANLTPKKDPATLLAAIDRVRRQLPDVIWCLIGSGPLEPRLRTEVAIRGLEDHVRLLGMRDDVPELLPAFDVFVLSSRFEGLGLSLLEAMAAGVACVSTGVGGVPEVITDRVNGRLVGVGDADALAAAITEVLTDDDQRHAMVTAGRALVAGSFATLDHIASRSEDLYLDAGTASRPERGDPRRRRTKASASDRPIRVLWLTKGLGLGGAERLLTVMAPKLDPARFELEVAYLLPWKDNFVPALTEAGVTTTCLGATRTMDPRWVWRLAQLLRRGRFDLVHTHSPVPAAAARLLAPRRTRLLHTEHNVWERYRAPTRLANQLTFGRNVTAFGVSDGVTASMTPPRWALGNPPHAETLLHGVDAEDVPRGPEARAASRRTLSISEDAPVIGTVANLTPKKDQATLLAAVDRLRGQLPDVELVIIGSGPLDAELRAEARRREMDAYVHFLGSRDDVADLLPGFDVFTLSSRYEGLPISMLEAMAAGVPVVVTAVGGIPEAITDGVHGRLVPPGDAHALTDGLHAVLSDVEVAGRLASAGRDRVAAAFSIDRAVRVSEERYAAIFDDG